MEPWTSAALEHSRGERSGPSVRTKSISSSSRSSSAADVDVVVPHNHPMALPKSNRQPDLKPLPLLRPWQKTPEQKDMMQ